MRLKLPQLYFFKLVVIAKRQQINFTALAIQLLCDAIEDADKKQK